MKYPRNKMKAVQKGLTLVELMLVLAVIAIIIAIGVGAYVITNSGAKAYGVSSDMMSLNAAVKTLYQNGTYTSIDAQTIAKTGKVPANMVDGSGNLKGKWGGTLTLAPTSVGSGTDNAFQVTYPNIPRRECNDMAATLAPIFDIVKVGTTTVKDRTAATPITFDAGTAATACDNDSNTFEMTAT
jgi:prepilin-type N-terminal cleavage/methylation domain-containing protein